MLTEQRQILENANKRALRGYLDAVRSNDAGESEDTRKGLARAKASLERTGKALREVGRSSNPVRAAGRPVGPANEDEPLKSSRTVSGRPQPFVVSVFPSVEAQTLDLRSSFRSQTALAMELGGMLQAAGLQSIGETLIDYAEQREVDAATRTAVPVLSAYSNGTDFGYRILPAFQALGEPADLEDGPSNVLHPVSFPALVLLVCDKSELEAGWTHIEFLVSSRWAPRDGGARTARYTEGQRLEDARRLDEALKQWYLVPTKKQVARPDGTTVWRRS